MAMDLRNFRAAGMRRLSLAHVKTFEIGLSGSGVMLAIQQTLAG